jgi:hypothetical protein
MYARNVLGISKRIKNRAENVRVEIVPLEHKQNANLILNRRARILTSLIEVKS